NAVWRFLVSMPVQTAPGPRTHRSLRRGRGGELLLSSRRGWGRLRSVNRTSFLGPKSVNRIGFGAMQLAGPGVFGPPADPEGARAVLRRAVELGVDHIDTSQYYGPNVVNDLIREA